MVCVLIEVCIRVICKQLFVPQSPSVLSLRGSSYDKLPPINKEPERLFDKPTRRHSIGEVRRPDTALSLRSPLRRGVSKGFGQDRQTSTDTLEYLTEPESPGLPKAVRRK
nr:uncharacterized protein LOC128703018 [Cherax quadricarinatus]